jgi:hypothetical protein
MKKTQIFHSDRLASLHIAQIDNDSYNLHPVLWKDLFMLEHFNRLKFHPHSLGCSGFESGLRFPNGMSLSVIYGHPQFYATHDAETPIEKCEFEVLFNIASYSERTAFERQQNNHGPGSRAISIARQKLLTKLLAQTGIKRLTSGDGIVGRITAPELDRLISLIESQPAMKFPEDALEILKDSFRQRHAKRTEYGRMWANTFHLTAA